MVLLKKPKMQASIELWEHTLLLKQADRESFAGGVQAWNDKWRDFLNERKIDAKGKNIYVHTKLRSAARCLVSQHY